MFVVSYLGDLENLEITLSLNSLISLISPKFLICKSLNINKIPPPYKMGGVFVYPYIELSFIIYVTRLLLQI